MIRNKNMNFVKMSLMASVVMMGLSACSGSGFEGMSKSLSNSFGKKEDSSVSVTASGGEYVEGTPVINDTIDLRVGMVIPPNADDDIERAVRAWASDRFRAIGGTGVARVIVDEVGIASHQMQDRFGDGTHIDYVGRVGVTLLIEDDARRFYNPPAISAVAERQDSIDGDSSAMVREAVQMDIMAQMLADIDNALSDAADEHLADYVVR